MPKLSLSAPFDRYQLPGDRVEVLTRIVDLLDAAQHSVRLFMYGFTQKDSYDALIRAQKRGVDVQLILDHTQSRGTREVAMLHYLFLQGFPVANVVISTSPVHREIMHEKVLVCDERYVQEGSYNWSDSGLQEVNSVIVFDSPQLAAAYLADWNTLKAWALVNEVQYQTELKTDTPAA